MVVGQRKGQRGRKNFASNGEGEWVRISRGNACSDAKRRKRRGEKENLSLVAFVQY